VERHEIQHLLRMFHLPEDVADQLVVGRLATEPQNFGMDRSRRYLGLALLAFSLELLFWNFSLPLPGRTGGQEPPEPNHENRFVIDVANELWYGADDMLTAGAFMGDEGWAARGESPATLGSVGISLRNAAEALLLADWYDCSGELEVAGAAGDYYFLEEDFFSVAAALPGNADSEEDFDTWGLEQSAPTADAAVAALGRLSAEMDSLAGRINVESVAGQALSRTAENWRRAARLFQGKPADESEEEESADSAALPSKVQEALAEAMSDTERQSTLRRLLKEYHPDQNPGEEDDVLPVFLKLQELRFFRYLDTENLGSLDFQEVANVIGPFIKPGYRAQAAASRRLPPPPPPRPSSAPKSHPAPRAQQGGAQSVDPEPLEVWLTECCRDMYGAQILITAER
ncbi:unnamed protein product, partial [Symbiodinium sp. KB8]